MELCRRYGISKPTIYPWKAKYGGLQVDEARRLRQLEDENRRLAARREAVVLMRQEVGLSERRACGLIGLRRSTYRYAPRERRGRWVRYGYRRLYDRLRRDGWRVNHKRVYRLYRLEELGLRRKSRKRAAGLRVIPLVPPRRANERWAMDFMTDALSNGRRFGC